MTRYHKSAWINYDMKHEQRMWMMFTIKKQEIKLKGEHWHIIFLYLKKKKSMINSHFVFLAWLISSPDDCSDRKWPTAICNWGQGNKKSKEHVLLSRRYIELVNAHTTSGKLIILSILRLHENKTISKIPNQRMSSL